MNQKNPSPQPKKIIGLSRRGLIILAGAGALGAASFALFQYADRYVPLSKDQLIAAELARI